MKKLVLVCSFLIGISAVSFAQGGGRQRQTPAEQVGRLKTALSLTDDQVTKATAIYTAQAKSRDSIMTASNGDRAASRPAQAALRTATAAKIKAILTPEQAATFQKQQDEMAARRQNGGGGGGNQ